MSIFFLVLCQREEDEKERERITGSTQLMLHSSMPTLWQGGRDTHTHTGKPTMKHMHTQPQTHTRLEADAVLISVTVAEPLAARITAGGADDGRKTMLRLHKDEHRNKGSVGCKHPLAWTQTKIYSMMEKKTYFHITVQLEISIQTKHQRKTFTSN